MLEQTISERIMEVVIQIIMQLLEFLAIDIDETLRLIVGDEEETKKLYIILSAVNQHSNDKLTKIKTAS